jgi:hypothetical protein
MFHPLEISVTVALHVQLEHYNNTGGALDTRNMMKERSRENIYPGKHLDSDAGL